MPDEPPVLVIEDDDGSRALIADDLRYLGYRVAEAVTGEDGVALASRELPRLVILDLLLPGMDGWQVVEALRAAERTRQVPVLVLSVLDPGYQGHRIDGYLVKPFTIAQIEDRVRELAGPVRRRPGA